MMRQVGSSTASSCNNGSSNASGGKTSYRRGHWSVEEDTRLTHFVAKYGQGRWNKLAQAAGLQRCGKSCRLRWVNYLRPDVKRGRITDEEEHAIISLHSLYGNRWSLIAIHLPGRSDNEIKNYWRSHIKKKYFKLLDADSISSTTTTTTTTTTTCLDDAGDDICMNAANSISPLHPNAGIVSDDHQCYHPPPESHDRGQLITDRCDTDPWLAPSAGHHEINGNDASPGGAASSGSDGRGSHHNYMQVYAADHHRIGCMIGAINRAGGGSSDYMMIRPMNPISSMSSCDQYIVPSRYDHETAVLPRAHEFEAAADDPTSMSTCISTTPRDHNILDQPRHALMQGGGGADHPDSTPVAVLPGPADHHGGSLRAEDEHPMIMQAQMPRPAGDYSEFDDTPADHDRRRAAGEYIGCIGGGGIRIGINSAATSSPTNDLLSHRHHDIDADVPWDVETIRSIMDVQYPASSGQFLYYPVLDDIDDDGDDDVEEHTTTNTSATTIASTTTTTTSTTTIWG